MKRSTKKGSGVYYFLHKSGVLANGTPGDIAQAKKEYWATVRKEYKRQKRLECNSYTVFFTRFEIKLVSDQANQLHLSITQYIKQAAVSNNVVIDKKAIGEIRQGLALLYSSIQSLYEEHKLPEPITRTLLRQIVTIETMIKKFRH